jgi:hypothetical protein
LGIGNAGVELDFGANVEARSYFIALLNEQKLLACGLKITLLLDCEKFDIRFGQ